MVPVQVGQQNRLHIAGGQAVFLQFFRDMSVRQAGVKQDLTAFYLHKKRQNVPAHLSVREVFCFLLRVRPDEYGRVRIRFPVEKGGCFNSARPGGGGYD